MRSLHRILPVVAFSLLVLARPGPLSAAKEPTAPAPPARVLSSLDLPGELQWYYQNDVGMLVVYAGGRLHRFDLLAAGTVPLEAAAFPKVSRTRSVAPVPGTGLLLISDAPGGALDGARAGASSSYAFDTLGGRMLWEAKPLPPPARVFSFPDAGTAVLLSFEGGGSLTAIDLRTGSRVWSLAMPVDAVWHDGRWLRLISERSLLTVDLTTGNTMRRDELTLPKSKLLRAYPEEEVLIAWSNKNLKAFSMPPPPPADAAPARPLWEFDAASPMMDIAVNADKVYIRRVEDDLLVVKSVRHYELVRLRTGRRVLDIKQGLLGFDMPFLLSPGGGVVAVADGEGLRVHDGQSGEPVHDIRYPPGGEGLKTARHIQWLDDDVVGVVFPDKRGNPKRISAFSSARGALLWSVVLPDAADYELTAEQRAALITRITVSLFATAASVGHPMSVGGANYGLVLVPSLDVATVLPARLNEGQAATAGGGTGAPAFAAALGRAEECRRRTAPGTAGHSYFAAGTERDYEILRIGFERGDVTTAFSYREPRVHAIVFFPAFERALSLENENRRVRLLSLK